MHKMWLHWANLPNYIGSPPKRLQSENMGQVISGYFSFPYQFSFHQLFYIHHHHHWDWYTGPTSGWHTKWPQVKGKLYLCLITPYMREWRLSSTILSISTRQEASGQLQAPTTSMWGQSHLYLLYRKLGGAQSWSGCHGENKISHHCWELNPDPSVVQPIV
jgi:hypothetical protein